MEVEPRAKKSAVVVIFLSQNFTLNTEDDVFVVYVSLKQKGYGHVI